MAGVVKSRTPQFGLKLINYDVVGWQGADYDNLRLIDALFGNTGVASVKGVWENDTAYVVDDRVFDAQTGAFYVCAVSHTSAVSGTFASDRAAHPTYWNVVVGGLPTFRGAWTTATAYSSLDIVNVGYAYYVCIDPHTSSANFATDSTKWSLIFDATDVVDDTAADALAASNSADAAAISAVNASTSEDNAHDDFIAMDTKYLGSKSSLPALDNQGNALIIGAQLFYTPDKRMYQYDGTNWIRQSLVPHAVGLAANKSAYDSEVEGFSYLAADTNLLYFRVSATPGVWSVGVQYGAGTPAFSLLGVDVLTSSGTYTKGAGTLFYIEAIGAGGGGGSGRRGAAGSNRNGGVGGGAGCVIGIWVDAADIDASCAYTIGASSPGGAGQTSNDTDGNAGTVGGLTSITLNATTKARLRVRGGGQGNGGNSSGTTQTGSGGGFDGSTNTFPAIGGSSSTGAGGDGQANVGTPASGGGGGGINASNTATAGGSTSGIGVRGSQSSASISFITQVNGGSAGANGASSSNNGPPNFGGGGSGGGSHATTPGNGGDGSIPGGGGGGGGASTNGATSGAGGSGARGEIRIYRYG